MAFKDVTTRCQATTKAGNPCGNPALLGEKFCRNHADIMGLERKKKSWREAGMILKLPDADEQIMFDFALLAVERDFDLNESSDQMQAQMSAFYFVKWHKAAAAGEKDVQILYDDLMRKNLGCLKATREKREGLEIKITTPAEWAAKLLAEMAGGAVSEDEQPGDQEGESNSADMAAGATETKQPEAPEAKAGADPPAENPEESESGGA